MYRLTYLECAKELVVTDGAVTIAIEVRHQVLGLFLGQIETVVNETPSEVLHIELTVTIVVHGLEDSGDALDSTGGAVKDFSFHLSHQVLNAEGLELLHGHGVAGVRRVANEPDVLVVLELSGHVTRDISLVFHG